MDEREILEQAHQHIQNMDYRNARRLLLRIPSHPTAAKWLTKLDAMQPQAPVRIAKPLPDLDVPRRTKSQKSQSTPVLLYSLIGGVGLTVVLIVVALGTFTDYFSPPGNFKNERISLSYGQGWVPQSVGSHVWCYSVGLECLFYMTTRPDIGLLVSLVEFSQPLTAFEFGESQWQFNLEDGSFEERDLKFDEFSLAGLPATAYMYYTVPTDGSTVEHYVVNIYFTDGTDGYVINMLSKTPCELESKIGAINEMLSTLRIASDTAWVDEDGYTEASDVELTIWACEA